jgi:hypothetical protein
VPYTAPTPSTVAPGDTFPSTAYNIIAGDIADHETRIKTGVESYTTAQKTALTGVSTGTLIYDSTLNQLQIWNGSAWLRFVNSSPSAYIQRTTSYSYTVSNTAITYESALYDTNSMWSAGTPTTLTIKTAGVYLVSFKSTLSMTTVTNPVPAILLNNTAGWGFSPVNVGGGAAYGVFSAVIPCAVNDQITTQWQWSAITGSGQITGSSSIQSYLHTSLSATMIARTT